MVWFIVIVVILFIIIKFNNDKDVEKHRISNKGGMEVLYPNFIKAIEELQSTNDGPVKLYKRQANKLEYKIACWYHGQYLGEDVLCISYEFGMYISLYFITPDGKKINGHIKQYKNHGDQEVYEYLACYVALMQKLRNVDAFKQYIVELLG